MTVRSGAERHYTVEATSRDDAWNRMQERLRLDGAHRFAGLRQTFGRTHGWEVTGAAPLAGEPW